ncbi:MAG TPA: hypothetical protein VGB76_02100 [Pyrinomonadaceae bacterium]|jgi:hypothetical protein
MAEQSDDAQDAQTPQSPQETEEVTPQPPPPNRFWRALNPVISRVPHTKAFHSRIAKGQESLREVRLEKYEQVTSVSPDVKSSLFVEFDRNTRQLSEVELWIEMIQFYMGVLIGLIILSLFLVMPPLAAEFFPPFSDWNSHGLWNWSLEFLWSLLVAPLAFAIIFVPFLVTTGAGAKVENFLNLDRLMALWASFLLLVASGYLYALYTGGMAAQPPLFRQRPFFYFTLQTGFFLPTIFVLSVPGRLFFRSLESRKQAVQTRAFVIDELLNILHRHEEPGYELIWSEFTHRKWLAERLEAIASCMENHFPRYFITGVPEMDRWATLTASEMANGVRATIKWVFAPTRNTREEFKARIVKYFIAALASEWGKFDRVTAEKLSRKEGLRARVVSVVTALFTAAVPILLLLLVRRLQLVAEPLLTYLTVGSYIWAALSLLSHLDPHYNTKLAALKDLTKTLPFGKRGGDDS